MMNRDPKQPTPPETIEAMHRHLLGDLGAEEFAHLEREMLTSPALRQSYLQAVRLETCLHDEAVQVYEETALVPQTASWWRPAAVAATVAAVITFSALGLWRADRDESPPPVVAMAPLAVGIATLGDARECEWKDFPELPVNQRLSARMLALDSGVAVIEFDGGARLALQGPAALELIDTKTARLLHGSASVRCEDGRYSFSLLTPTSTVVDLGTEFGVAVADDGTSEVHVLDGEVEVVGGFEKERPLNQFLTAGKTLRLGSDGENEELSSSSHQWVRDYSTEADRDAKAIPPKVFARDRFPTGPTDQNKFALGTGWNSAWWRSTPKRTQLNIAFGALRPLVSRDGQPAMAMIVGGWVEARRLLAEPLNPTRPQTIYLGYSLYRMNPHQRSEDGKLSEATVMLRSSGDPASFLGMGLSGRNYLVVREQGGWERSETPVDDTRPLFVMAKIELDPVRGNRVSMSSYDQSSAIPKEEPQQWELVTRRELAQLSAPLDLITLQVRKSPFKFGEVTLGNSWHAVVDPAIADQ